MPIIAVMMGQMAHYQHHEFLKKDAYTILTGILKEMDSDEDESGWNPQHVDDLKSIVNSHPRQTLKLVDEQKEKLIQIQKKAKQKTQGIER